MSSSLIRRFCRTCAVLSHHRVLKHHQDKRIKAQYSPSLLHCSNISAPLRGRCHSSRLTAPPFRVISSSSSRPYSSCTSTSTRNKPGRRQLRSPSKSPLSALQWPQHPRLFQFQRRLPLPCPNPRPRHQKALSAALHLLRCPPDQLNARLSAASGPPPSSDTNSKPLPWSGR